MKFKKSRLLSLLTSFMCAGYAQAFEPRGTNDRSSCSSKIPCDLIPLYQIMRFTYVPDIFATLNANNDTGGNGGNGSGGGDTGGVCGIEDPDGELSQDEEEPYDCDDFESDDINFEPTSE